VPCLSAPGAQERAKSSGNFRGLKALSGYGAAAAFSSEAATGSRKANAADKT
jgi:hypothetical protein